MTERVAELQGMPLKALATSSGVGGVILKTSCVWPAHAGRAYACCAAEKSLHAVPQRMSGECLRFS